MAGDREIGEPVWKANDLFAIGDDARDAAGDRHHGERRNEGRHAEAGHHQARRQAASRGSDERDKNGDDERPLTVVSEVAHHHAGEREHGTDREVDTPDQDDQRHSNRHHPENGDLIHDVQEVAHRQERIRREGQEHAEKDEADKGSRRAAHKSKSAAAGAFRR